MQFFAADFGEVSHVRSLQNYTIFMYKPIPNASLRAHLDDTKFCNSACYARDGFDDAQRAFLFFG